MSVLMFLNDGDDASWPSDGAIERYRDQNAGDERAVKVFDSRSGPKSVVDAVDREFKLSEHHGHGVRLVLTGYRDPALAKRLYRERGLPVHVVFSTVEIADGGDWSDAFWSDQGITMSGWNCPAGDDEKDDLDMISQVVQFVNDLTYDYRWYVRGLRDIPSAADQAHVDCVDGVYASTMDTFGGGVEAVEPVLDAILEQLCGAACIDPAAAVDYNRWTLASGVVEEGDKAAEDGARLVAFRNDCSATAALDYTRRTTRVAASFAHAFWHDHSVIAATSAGRTLAACLIENLRAAADAELAELSAEQFAVCLTAKFIATRRWRRTAGDSSVSLSTAAPSPSFFRPEIRERCERFLAVEHLVDLMAAGDDNNSFVRSHVEHLEPHVLPQRLVDYVSRYFEYEVRYFELADTLVFRFTDGERGRFVEQSHVHRFAGPRNFKEFHAEAFRTIDFKSGSRGADRPLAVTDPNVFRYREFGYVEASDFAVRYVSATGDIKIRAEMYELRDDDDDDKSAVVECEQRYRMKVECGEFWVTVHSVVMTNYDVDGDKDRQTELTVGLTDGTVVAVTRSPGDDFCVTPRTPNDPADDLGQRYEWSDGRPVFEFFDDVATVNAAGGTWISVDFGRADKFVCATCLSDGARVRMTMTRPAVHFCHNSESGEPVTDKYLVCRRDLSGYEFVDDHDSGQTVCRTRESSDHGTPSPVTVVRTLTRNRFDHRMAGLMDKALSDHLMTIKTLADRLNSGLPENDSHDVDELDELLLDEPRGSTSFVSHLSLNV
ncbi:LOW QUALITY PROTEIN: uncharacterized protein LOC113560877 [Rhopalosiphum maidis]|uniref:LOW QUALITY PROTEIN: uncharacterized protein LOC113560877 n=1 Tax=Rhopalosiphum maidis TaxID=43146 RepID=UPI000EFE7224|nr:LOW QUALITY PROTEIN: uncharacterized protein LOC113560877 [Rhopalosiphum maidis]